MGSLPAPPPTRLCLGWERISSFPSRPAVCCKTGHPLSSWCHSGLCKQPRSRPHTDRSWRQQGAEPKAPGPEHCAQYSAALTTAVWGEMRKKRLSLPPWKPQTLHRPYKSPKRQLIRAFGVPPLTNPFPAPTHGCPGSRCG